MEVFTGYPNQTSDAVNNRNRKMGASRGRSEKNAIRVCGDWSEQLSSKGKIYFYNCITEVSQWQKPPEWKLPDMDPDELIRRLAHRESQSDGKSLKRSLLSTACQVKRGVDDRQCSPKRSKINLDSSLHSEVANKFNHSFIAPSPDHRLLDGRSPKSLSRSFSQQVYSEPLKTRSHILSSRSVPADDMEISPNSSPLSNCSSANANLSPDFPKSNRLDHQNLSSQFFRQATPHETSSGTLRQLVDAIRASIGGLLDCPSTGISESSNDSEAQKIQQSQCPTRVPSSANYISDYNTEAQIREHMVPTTRKQCNHGCSSTSTSIRDKRDTDPQSTTMPGLVSTLTTLVSLIGHSKCPDVQNCSSPVVTSTVFRPNFSQRSILPTPVNNLTTNAQSPSTPLEQRVKCGVSAQTLSHAKPQHIAIDEGVPRPSDLFEPDFASSYIETETTPTKSSVEYSQPFRMSFRSSVTEKTLPHSDYSNGAVDTSYQMSDSVGFSNRSTADGAEDPRMRHPSDSLDGYDRLSSSRCRVQYPPKRMNGVCDSPIPSLRSSYSPVTKFGSKESSVLDNCPTTESPSKALPSEAASFPTGDSSSLSSKTKDERSPDDTLSEDECVNSVTRLLSSSSTQVFVDVSILSRFLDKSVERLEQEAQQEARKFENLQSVLYGELSAESKKLRALVRISEAKLAIHREKQTALQDLMDAIETRKHLPNLSFADDVL